MVAFACLTGMCAGAADEDLGFGYAGSMGGVSTDLGQSIAVDAVGECVEDWHRLELVRPERVSESVLHGSIVRVDRFGNLITNVRATDLGAEIVVVEIKGREMHGVDSTYGNKNPGELMCLIGSSGYLEVAVNQGSAEVILSTGVGTRVVATLRAKA